MPGGGFTLVRDGAAVDLFVDQADDAAVARAAGDLAADVERVSGVRPRLRRTSSGMSGTVVRLRVEALRLAEADAAAFTAVADAYSLPRVTDDEKALRRNMITVAQKGACVPPVAVVEVAADTVVLAERLIPIGNRSVITDVAAAAEAARAAATTARVNIEVNLGGITGADNKAELLASAHSVDLIVERAEKVTAAVRAELAA